MASIKKEFVQRGRINWIMKPTEGSKLTAYHDGHKIGTYKERYIKNEWRKAFGYTLPLSIILASQYVKLED